jgi:hypothetical protein
VGGFEEEEVDSEVEGGAAACAVAVLISSRVALSLCPLIKFLFARHKKEHIVLNEGNSMSST